MQRDLFHASFDPFSLAAAREASSGSDSTDALAGVRDAKALAFATTPQSLHVTGLFDASAITAAPTAFHFGQPLDLGHTLSVSSSRPESHASPGGHVFGAAPSLDDEVSFLNGIDSSGNVVGTSFWTWKGDRPATYANQSDAGKWGVDHATSTDVVTVHYFFQQSANWTTDEKAVWASCLDLWSAVSNVKFEEVASAGDAELTLRRGNDGSAYEFDSQSDSGGAGTIGDDVLFTKDHAVVSVDTSVGGFGPIDGDFTSFGGYVFGTLIHELGHSLGLGHAGAYNGSVNTLTQQFSPYDVLTWTIMSYIEPHQNSLYKADYPVQADWGTSPDGFHNTPTTWMPLDIVAIQALYGEPVDTVLDGGQTFGFNCNVGGDLQNFFDFTVNVNPVITIYSKGVGNTFDVSGFSEDSTVNLNPGTFSSCDGKTNNVAIAFDTIVETAIGGKGNDTFIANTDDDTLKGGKGNDTFDLSSTLSSADRIDGGRGQDTMLLNGDETVTFDALTLRHVETINLAAGHDYILTMHNVNVVNHSSLTIDGSALGASDGLDLDASDETAGSYVVTGGAANDVLHGGNGIDTLNGGGGSDTLTGQRGADIINGSGGDDFLVYTAPHDSTGTKFDTIQGFDFDGADVFDLRDGVTGHNATVSGTLSTATFDSDLSAVLDGSALGARHAVLFTATGGDYDGDTFLIVDGNGHAGYQDGHDYVFLLDGAQHLGKLDNADFT